MYIILWQVIQKFQGEVGRPSLIEFDLDMEVEKSNEQWILHT